MHEYRPHFVVGAILAVLGVAAIWATDRPILKERTDPGAVTMTEKLQDWLRR